MMPYVQDNFFGMFSFLLIVSHAIFVGVESEYGMSTGNQTIVFDYIEIVYTVMYVHFLGSTLLDVLTQTVF